VAALLLLDGDIVLVRHRKADSTYHLLPGGGVEYRESLENALVREVAEETGLDIRIGRPLIINDTMDPAGTRHIVNVTFGAAIIGGDIIDSPLDDRIECVELFSPERLTGLDLRPPIAEALLQAIRAPHTFQAVYLGDIYSAER
jgi:8-oxo-dGTP diphosphatase